MRGEQPVCPVTRRQANRNVTVRCPEELSHTCVQAAGRCSGVMVSAAWEYTWQVAHGE